MTETLPERLTPGLLAFCAEISNRRPIYVRSRPFAGARKSACFDNVAKKVARSGGRTVYGWAIWHLPGLYFEAEHHGIWKKRDGKLLDVSPQLGQVPKILLLPDPGAVYDPPNFRRNRFAAASDTQLSKEFVRLAQRRLEIRQSYHTDEFMVATLTKNDQAELAALESRLGEILRKAQA